MLVSHRRTRWSTGKPLARGQAHGRHARNVCWTQISILMDQPHISLLLKYCREKFTASSAIPPIAPHCPLSRVHLCLERGGEAGGDVRQAGR